MQNINIYICVFFLALLTLTACGRKKGCIDSNSQNYCSDCKKDDGNCRYGAVIGFWWKKPFKDSCVAHGITYFVAYDDGQMLGTAGSIISIPSYWGSEPDCQHASMAPSLDVKDLGHNKSGSISLSFKMYNLRDSLVMTRPGILFQVYGNGLGSGSCNMYEITW